MENQPVKYLFLSYLFLLTSESSSVPKRKERGIGEHWGYSSQNGPPTWGGYCQTGKSQSPINIRLGEVIVKSFPSFVFGEDFLVKQKFYAKNNGHTIYVGLEDDTVQAVISGGGLEGKFIFQQLHFHWESEHEFDGRRAALEMHLVHYNSKYNSFGQAATQPDGLAVLAVIFDESDQVNNITENFFGYVLDAAALEEKTAHLSSPENYLPGTEEHQVKTNDGFVLRDLLPERLSRFYRYRGSLTTPNCDEVVQWTVFINRLPVSTKVLEALRTLKDHDGNLLEQNFRPPKDLNDRDVYIQIKNYGEWEAEELRQLNGGTSQVAPFSYALICCSVIYLTF